MRLQFANTFVLCKLGLSWKQQLCINFWVGNQVRAAHKQTSSVCTSESAIHCSDFNCLGLRQPLHIEADGRDNWAALAAVEILQTQRSSSSCKLRLSGIRGAVIRTYYSSWIVTRNLQYSTSSGIIWVLMEANCCS